MEARWWTERLEAKKKWKNVVAVSLLIAFVGMLVVMNGCAVIPGRRRRRRVAVVSPSGSVDVIYVKKAPPAVKVEKRPLRPNKNAVWVPGHWAWRKGKYVWVSGHWDKKPRSKTWTPGHWEKKPRGWVWVPGRWK